MSDLNFSECHLFKVSVGSFPYPELEFNNLTQFISRLVFRIVEQDIQKNSLEGDVRI